MSDISDSSETYKDQDLSDTSQLELDVEDPDDIAQGVEERLGQANSGNNADFERPYIGKPLADEEWLGNYNRQRKRIKPDKEYLLAVWMERSR